MGQHGGSGAITSDDGSGARRQVLDPLGTARASPRSRTRGCAPVGRRGLRHAARPADVSAGLTREPAGEREQAMEVRRQHAPHPGLGGVGHGPGGEHRLDDRDPRAERCRSGEGYGRGEAAVVEVALHTLDGGEHRRRRDRLVHLEDDGPAVVQVGAEHAPGAGDVEARGRDAGAKSRGAGTRRRAWPWPTLSAVPKQACSTGAAGKASSAAWIVAAVAATRRQGRAQVDAVDLQLVLQHLAGGVAGQLVGEDELARSLVVGEPLGDEGAQLARRRGRCPAGGRSTPRRPRRARGGGSR